MCVPTICVLGKLSQLFILKLSIFTAIKIAASCTVVFTYCVNIFQCHLSKETGRNGQSGVTALPNVTAESRQGDVVVRSRRPSKLYRVPVVLRSGGCVILIYVKVWSGLKHMYMYLHYLEISIHL